MSSACALLLRRWAHNLSEVGLCWGAYKGPREEEHQGYRYNMFTTRYMCNGWWKEQQKNAAQACKEQDGALRRCVA